MFVLWDMPTERTRYGNIVINDTNDGLPCKYGGEFCFGSFILGGADSMDNVISPNLFNENAFAFSFIGLSTRAKICMMANQMHKIANID